MSRADKESIIVVFQAFGNGRRYVRHSVANGLWAANAGIEMGRRADMAQAIWDFYVSLNASGKLAARPLYVKGFQTLRQDGVSQSDNLAACRGSAWHYRGFWISDGEGANEKVRSWSVCKCSLPATQSDFTVEVATVVGNLGGHISVVSTDDGSQQWRPASFGGARMANRVG